MFRKAQENKGEARHKAGHDQHARCSGGFVTIGTVDLYVT